MARPSRANLEARRERPGTNPDLAGWCNTFSGGFSYVIAQDMLDSVRGPDIALQMKVGSAVRAIQLTNCTETELAELKKFLDHVFDLAAPIVKTRDRIAHDNLAAGDDSDIRVYRRLPDVVARPWSKPINRQSLQQRLNDASDLAKQNGNLSETRRTDDADVSEHDSD